MDVTFFLVLVRMEEELNDVREKRAENKNREIGFTLQGPTRIQEEKDRGKKRGRGIG